MIKKIIKKIKLHYQYKDIEVCKFNKISPSDKVIFVLRCDLIGDYVVSKDFLRLLRNCPKFKDYKIVFLGNSILKDFIIDFDSAYIDEYIGIKLNLFQSYEKYRNKVFKEINKYRYKYVINYMSIRNYWSETIVGNITSGQKLGIEGLAINLSVEDKQKYDKLYDKLYSTNNDYDLCGLELLNKISGLDNGCYIHSFDLDENKLNMYKKNYDYAVIFPSASAEIKRMPFDKFMQLIDYIYAKYGIISLLCGSKEDNKIFDSYDTNKPYIKNFCGKLKLSQLPYIFKNAMIILTNDTCAMHIAKCTNKNCLTFTNLLNTYSMDKNKLKVIEKGDKNYYLYCENQYNLIFPAKYYQYILANENIPDRESLSNVDIENAMYNIDCILNNIELKEAVL